jgi:transposase
MPQSPSVLGLPGYEIEKVEGIQPVIVYARYAGSVRCPRCQGESLRKKDRFIRKIRHESMGRRYFFLHLEVLKFRCRSCSRYFHQRFPGILPYRRHTEAFRRQVVFQHQQGISQKALAEREQIGSATIERWYHELLERKIRERQDAPCPQELGIDEHFFSRRKGYATTLCDLGGHRVFDVVLGRSEKALEAYFEGLAGKSNVRLVCMDLATHYRSLVRKHFPRAKIVADRFHVIRLVNQHFLATWKILDPRGRANRGLLSLMRRHRDRLRGDQQQRLDSYLRTKPLLETVYAFKQRLCNLLRLKAMNQWDCRRLIPRLLSFIEQLKESPLVPLIQLGRTLFSWRHEIARMLRFSKNNGITEGFHNKMEMISRRAFGFRNFENYRLRVRVLCS